MFLYIVYVCGDNVLCYVNVMLIIELQLKLIILNCWPTQRVIQCFELFGFQFQNK